MGAEIMISRPKILKGDELEAFNQDNQAVEFVDIYDSQIEELQRIQDPSGKSETELLPYAEETHVYYPWKRTLLRCVGKEELFTLRTNRNKNLITEQEQEKLRSAVIGVAGMSVGAGIAIGAVYSGMSSHIKIADHDVLDTSNLNRLRETLLSVSKPKVDLAARHIYELDPFVHVEAFTEGITEENIGQFFQDPRLSVVVDEIDDFKMKIMLRAKAREHKVPLIMFTSLGDNILVDIERFDLDSGLQLFHGLIPNLSEEILNKPELTPQDIRRYSVQLVGQEYIPTRALESVAEMGKTLVGRPQLYSTIAVDGGLTAYVLRNIILGSGPQSGRYFVKFSELVGIDSNELEMSDGRQEILGKLFNRNA